MEKAALQNNEKIAIVLMFERESKREESLEKRAQVRRSLELEGVTIATASHDVMPIAGHGSCSSDRRSR
jgi:hypothetical protein